jgi:hypothetical protein
MLISDSVSGWKLGESFAYPTSSKLLTTTATAINDGPLTKLTSLIGTDASVLGGWTISATSGFTAGDPMYLSFGLGTGKTYSSNDLQLWSYSGSQWSKFSANDLTCDANYANFTTTSMGCYAVTAVTTVPEPGTLLLLAFGLMGIAATGWRIRRN